MDQVTYPDAMSIPDEASLMAQRRFLVFTRIQLALLLIASGIGAASWLIGDVDVGALIAGFGLAAAAGVRLWLARRQPHRVWYEGRAAAESVKSLAWRYAVGGEPLPIGPTVGPEAFANQASAVVKDLPSISPDASTSVACRPTEWMERTRALSQADRITTYREGRIADQYSWYSRKSEWNSRRAQIWSGLVIGLLLLAAGGAFLKAFGVIDFDLFGLACAAVASGAAWSETKQHSTLATAYRVAASELAAIEDLLSTTDSEPAWARMVAEAEEAISREHTTWKSSSSQRKPVDLA